MMHMLKETTIQDLNIAENFLKQCHDEITQKPEMKDLFKQKMKSPKRKKSPVKSPKKEHYSMGALTPQKKRLLMDCLLCLAFINFEWCEWDISKSFFNKAYLVSMYLKEA